jgi:AcrR family transcriptional regulator
LVNKSQPGRARGRPSAGIRDAILKATYEIIVERGLTNLTTKEIADRAGASEASIYYHFADKTALVEGVILEAVLAPLKEFAAVFPKDAEGKSISEALTSYGRKLNAFWERVLPILSAVQADLELRAELASRLTDLGYGPHRGVRVLARYLANEQRQGRVRPDLDTRQAAMSFAGACFLSAYQRHMFGQAARRKLPPLEATLTTLVRLIEP